MTRRHISLNPNVNTLAARKNQQSAYFWWKIVLIVACGWSSYLELLTIASINGFTISSAFSRSASEVAVL